MDPDRIFWTMGWCGECREPRYRLLQVDEEVGWLVLSYWSCLPYESPCKICCYPKSRYSWSSFHNVVDISGYYSESSAVRGSSTAIVISLFITSYLLLLLILNRPLIERELRRHCNYTALASATCAERKILDYELPCKEIHIQHLSTPVCLQSSTTRLSEWIISWLPDWNVA